MKYIDCKAYAQEILDEVKATPNKKELVIMSMGDNQASQSYIKGKMKDCEYCEIPYVHIHTNTYESLERYIQRFNMDSKVGGIIVQLPLPDREKEEEITNMIWSKKDVDGFVPNSKFQPCTPEGIMYVIKKELGNDLSGKRALVIGRGKLVGKPVAEMLLKENCTVTVAHSKTEDLDMLTTHADIIVCAVGKPNFLDLQKCCALVVVDAGVNRDENGKLCGDCYNFNPDLYEFMSVTPVPNGIGLMTRAMLMKHMVEHED